MSIGKAVVIFEQIESDVYTDAEKLTAIRTVLGMETHNGVAKDLILKAFGWLFAYEFE